LSALDSCFEGDELDFSMNSTSNKAEQSQQWTSPLTQSKASSAAMACGRPNDLLSRLNGRNCTQLLESAQQRDPSSAASNVPTEALPAVACGKPNNLLARLHSSRHEQHQKQQESQQQLAPAGARGTLDVAMACDRPNELLARLSTNRATATSEDSNGNVLDRSQAANMHDLFKSQQDHERHVENHKLHDLMTYDNNDDDLKSISFSQFTSDFSLPLEQHLLYRPKRKQLKQQ
jgi:hypothetical protein